MEVDWDLHAVVRACCSATAATTSSAATTTAGAATSWPENNFNQHNISFQDEKFMVFFPDPFQSRNDNSIEQFLNDLNTPLDFQKVPKLPHFTQSLPISPLSVLNGLQDPPLHHQQQKQIQGKQQSFGVTRCTTPNAQSTRSKKRKNQMKRVCQVPAEGLASDVWSWRKYGQKPIKGSPYPRGYYRCSTSKRCLARKQVERNRSDPDMFIVTYTGEHNHPIPTHRNSLAGSTRNKPTTSTEDDLTSKHNKPTFSPTTSQSPATENPDNENDTDDDNLDIVMDDNFFDGLYELVGPVIGDDLPSPVTSPSFPWLSNNITTVAGGR